MRAIVVYDSVSGITQAVAEAIAEGLRGRFEVCVTEVGEAPTALVGVDLLVIGEPHSAGVGVREYLHALPDGSGEVSAATFATSKRGLAATPAARRLEDHGYRMLVKPEHFYVAEPDGPLEHGELERARIWGVGLADAYLRSLNHHDEASRSGT